VATADLPEARQPGADAEATAASVVGKARHLFDGETARPDQAHLAAQHVPKLGQLVEAVPPEDAAKSGDARIRPDLEHRALHLVAFGKLGLARGRVRVHRAEFVEGEGPAVQPRAVLAKNHGA